MIAPDGKQESVAPESAAANAQDWRNVTGCMCSVIISYKHGAIIDTTACSIHGKAAKK